MSKKSHQKKKKKLRLKNLRKINNEVIASLAYQTENHINCKDCHKLFPVVASAAMICNEDKDLCTFYEHKALGLNLKYQCPKCKDCKKGDIFEEISINEEAEQLEIYDSLEINEDINRITARLPFRIDPEEALTDNRHIAENALERLCPKYDDKAKAVVLKAIEKLHKNGHLLFEDEFT